MRTRGLRRAAAFGPASRPRSRVEAVYEAGPVSVRRSVAIGTIIMSVTFLRKEVKSKIVMSVTVLRKEVKSTIVMSVTFLRKEVISRIVMSVTVLRKEVIEKPAAETLTINET